MLHALMSSFAEFNALWLIGAAAGVLVLAAGIVIASAVTNEREESFERAAPSSPNKRKITV